MDVKIKLPEKVKYILDMLHRTNYEAYVVGGCVRDSLLGRVPQDWDITTSALPGDVMDIFGRDRTIPTGLKYGTVTVLLDKETFEVTTYRVDLKYSDNRRPDEVRFTSSLEEELKRRDFTINAMAYGEDSGLMDFFDGLEDIKRRIIRCVGDGDRRFEEDALRMMRAVRFGAQLGFDIEPKTLSSIAKKCSLLEKISRERINQELNKILLSANPDKIRLLFSTGLMNYIIPELMEYYKSGSIDRCINAIARADGKLHIRMALFLQDLGESAYHVLKRLKYDNNTIDRVSTLVKHCKDAIDCSRASLRTMLSEVGEEDLKDIISMRIAMAEGNLPLPGKGCETEYKSQLRGALETIDDIIRCGECFEVKCLEINGCDLIELGFRGAEVGEVLKRLLHMVVENPGLNNREKLLELAASFR